MKIFCVCLIIITCTSLIAATGIWHLIVPKFGSQFVGNAFQIYIRITWMRCLERCNSIRKCQWINYYPRMSGLCELFEHDDDTDPVLEPRESVWTSSKSDCEYDEPQHCHTCSDNEMCTSSTEQTCKKAACPNRVPTAVTYILGNRNHIGATRLYICGNREHQLITCSDDGSWPNVNLLCCKNTQPNIDHASLDITESESGMEATIVCDSGYANLGDMVAQCDDSSGDWTSLDRLACVKLQDNSWKLVYGKMHGAPGGILDSWDKEDTDNGDFRNSDILESWDSRNIIQVKVNVLDFSENVVITLTFDGTSDWFSQENIVGSSWTDLEPNSPQDIRFSIEGLKAKVTEGREELEDKEIRIRWGILDYEDGGGNTINCASHKVWLGIMKPKHHPSEDVKETRGVEGHVIVYSSSTTGTTWNDGHWNLAKMMLIYVQMQTE